MSAPRRNVIDDAAGTTPLQRQVLGCLAGGQQGLGDIAEQTGRDRRQIGSSVSSLCRRLYAEPIGPATWTITEEGSRALDILRLL